jgi:fibronectin type 3 domain-containing protein
VPIAWTNGGSPAINAANLNKLAVVDDVATAGTPTGDALRAAYLPKWKANTAYASGEPVLNPSGQTVTANSAFTSGATYDASKWTVVSGSGGGGAVSSVAGRTGAVTLTSADLTDATTVGRSLLTAADAAAERTALGLGTAATQPTSAFDAAGAAAAVLPSKTGNAGKYLTTDGTAVSWGTPAGGSSGASPVTTVATAGASQTLTIPTHGTAAYDITASAATCTFTLTGGTAGEECWLTLYLHQDNTGGRAWAFPGGVRWPNGNTAPTFSANPGQYDIVSLVTTDGGTSFTAFLGGLGFQAPALPSVTSLSGTLGNTQNVLNWPAATGNGASITNYKIYRGATAGSETLLTTIGNVLTYTDTGLTNGTTYYYKVSAVNSVGEGPLSNEINLTPGTVSSTSIATETFTAADSTAALYNFSTTTGKTTDTGAKVWSVATAAPGNWGISSNQGYNSASGLPAILAVDSGVSDYTVQADVIFSAAANDSGLAFRVADANNWLNFMVDPGGFYIQKKVAGTQSNAANVAQTIAAGQTFTLKVIVSGTSVSCYANGSLKLSYTITDSALNTGSKIGLLAAGSGTTAMFDNFSATTP